MPRQPMILGSGLLVATLIGSTACKEDPPPPPAPSATGSASPANKEQRAKTQMAQGRSQVPRVDKDTMKRYRIETCFFGAQGLRLLRDDYLASTKGGMPTADKLPSFGDYPPPPGVEPPAEKKDSPAQRRRAMSVTAQVPFIRYLRYCAIAKALKDPEVKDLDAALVEFNKFATPVSQHLIQATRYWGTKQFEKDDFKRGKVLHEHLAEALPKVDEQLASLVGPVNAYAATAPAESPEKLDEAGKRARTAIADARALAVSFLPDGKAEDRAKLLETVTASVAKLKEVKDEKAPHVRAVTPKLEAFVEAAKAAVEADTPTEKQRYLVMFTMADIVEANQRALNQLLRSRGDMMPGGKPTRVLSPNIRDRINVPGRITPKARPAPSAE